MSCRKPTSLTNFPPNHALCLFKWLHPWNWFKRKILVQFVLFSQPEAWETCLWWTLLKPWLVTSHPSTQISKWRGRLQFCVLYGIWIRVASWPSPTQNIYFILVLYNSLPCLEEKMLINDSTLWENFSHPQTNIKRGLLSKRGSVLNYL